MAGQANSGDLGNIRLLVNGSELVSIPTEIAAAFREGDRLLALPGPEFMHIPRAQAELASAAVEKAKEAFRQLSQVPPQHVTRFYECFACAMEKDAIWSAIEYANQEDVRVAQESGRSTTRLSVSPKMRRDMIAGLREWRDLPSPVGEALETNHHPGWRVDHVVSPLGVVAFVFEGRPNVFADATGVLRSGNTAVMRIGRDALRTAQAIMDRALLPSLKEAGLPEGAVTLIQSREHSAGWALFSDSRVSLAIARGSGSAVRQLGAVARQAGIPASLHGTGGAWLMASRPDPDSFYQAVYHSLDRKVCNTLNTICLPEEEAASLAPVLLKALETRAQEEGNGFRLHLTSRADPFFPSALFESERMIQRAAGPTKERIATRLAEEELGKEWEWEQTPELSVAIVDNLAEAVQLFNRWSPQFIASLVSEDPTAQEFFFSSINAPFVGSGFTRWVDGQFALNRPELGLSNWQNGRLLGRSAILSGDSIYTIRLRVYQEDPGVHR